MPHKSIGSVFRSYMDGIIQRLLFGQTLEPNLDYWRNIFFAYILGTLIPLGMITLLMGLYLAYSNGFYLLAAGSIFVYLLFIAIAFLPGIPIQKRKVLFVIGLYIISVLMIYYLGSYGPGLILLFAITLFVVLITGKKLAMVTVLINLLICLGFAVSLWLGFVFPFYGSDFAAEAPTISWLAVSSLPLTISYLTAIVIPKLFEGLQQIIDSQKVMENKLNSMLKEVESKNSELEEFAYTASHDLKEPLRMVRSFMELLRKNYSDRLDEKAGRYIHFAVDGAERMGKLIDDLLHYSRVGRIHTKVERIDLNDLLQTIAGRVQQETDTSTVTIHLGELPQIEGVRVTIEMLFNNLIGNAIKYQPVGNIPEIHVESYATEKYFHFRVTDNGIGIPKEYQDDIFKIFKRLHTSEEYEGSGLGLAICKKIVAQHGGEITVRSEPGVGSTFEFSLKK